MIEEKISFIGHHGTLYVNSKKIKREGFEESKSGWLGKGIYFFEDDKELARMWANYKKGTYQSKIDVIECNISLEQEKILDIVDPKSVHSKMINEFRENFLKVTLKENKIIKTEDTTLDGKILDMICNRKGYSLVRNSTHTLTESDRKLGIKFSNLKNGIELCVKDKNIIDII